MKKIELKMSTAKWYDGKVNTVLRVFRETNIPLMIRSLFHSFVVVVRDGDDGDVCGNGWWVVKLLQQRHYVDGACLVAKIIKIKQNIVESYILTQTAV